MSLQGYCRGNRGRGLPDEYVHDINLRYDMFVLIGQYFALDDIMDPTLLYFGTSCRYAHQVAAELAGQFITSFFERPNSSAERPNCSAVQPNCSAERLGCIITVDVFLGRVTPERRLCRNSSTASQHKDFFP